MTTAAAIPNFTCPVCSSAFKGAVIATETTPQGEQVAIQRCPTCGLHITYPRLAAPQDEYQSITRAQWESKYHAIISGERPHDRHANYVEEASTIARYLPQAATILDVGCNAGWLLGYLQQEKPFQLEGLEPSPVYAEIARSRLPENIPIHNCYLHELDKPAAYDGIVATDVIEHINPEDLPAFGQALARLLAAGGYVFLKTPNAHFVSLKAQWVRYLPAFLRRWLIRNHDVWDAKEHVVFWDADTLTRFVENHCLQLVNVSVPLPVETYNSPTGARLARQLIYRLALLSGGKRRVPFFAQDLWLIARKPIQ